MNIVPSSQGSKLHHFEKYEQEESTTFWRLVSLVADDLAPGRFGAKHIFHWDIRLWDNLR